MVIPDAQPGVAQPGLGTALVAGAVIGFFVVLAIVSVALLLAGAPLAKSLGVAAFVAAFGGPGFGTMFGATWYVHRQGDPV